MKIQNSCTNSNANSSFFHFHSLRNNNTLQKLNFYDKTEFGMANKIKNDHFVDIFENLKFQKYPLVNHW